MNPNWKCFLEKYLGKQWKKHNKKPKMELRNGSEMNITLWQRAVPSKIIRQTLRARTHEMKWKTWLREFWLEPLFPHPPATYFLMATKTPFGADGARTPFLKHWLDWRKHFDPFSNTFRPFLKHISQDPLSQTHFDATLRVFAIFALKAWVLIVLHGFKQILGIICFLLFCMSFAIVAWTSCFFHNVPWCPPSFYETHVFWTYFHWNIA